MTASRLIFLLPALLLALAIAGCSSTGNYSNEGRRSGGGYYQDDGPGDSPPSDIDAIPDAVPRIEPLASGANKPYVVFGKTYVPITDSTTPFRQQGIASWYGRKFHGQNTSNGEPYDMYAMTAAHPTMPIPSYARVTSGINGKTVIVRVNDRGPFLRDRVMDLSYAAAYKLGIAQRGSGPVTIERILPEEIRMMAAKPSGASPEMQPVAASAAPIPEVLAPTELPAPNQPVSTPLPPPAAATGGVYLQMGAFSQQSNAQTLVSRLNEQLRGMLATPATVMQSGPLYRVRIGPYASREEALAAVPKVNERTGILPSLMH